jgi:hypothetical protein
MRSVDRIKIDVPNYGHRNTSAALEPSPVFDHGVQFIQCFRSGVAKRNDSG